MKIMHFEGQTRRTDTSEGTEKSQGQTGNFRLGLLGT